ncbi:titin-like [Salvelinus alpinus]|uniref:titin-like n=1 Tax=Salvelinus alpinus TaxID=8036 RepID=UPI0039FC53B0
MDQELGFEEGQSVLLLEKFTTVQAALGSPPRTPVVDLSSCQDSSCGPLFPLGHQWWTSPPIRTPVVDLSPPLDSSVVDLSSPHDSSGGTLLPSGFQWCGERESIRVLQERLCASVNFKNPNMSTCTLERLKRTNPIGLNTSSASQYASTGTRRMAPINGDECFFWRTTGCFYDVQVKVTPYSQISTWKTLTCSTTSCPLTGNPTYTWYKNRQVVTENTLPYSVYPDAADSYSCVQDQYCNRVTYTKRRICVLKGSTVDISCTYVGYNRVKSSLWFSPKRSASWTNKLTPEDLTRDPGYAGRVQYTGRETGTYEGPSSLRITDLREEDSAEYRFTFKTHNFEWGHSFPGTTLSVTGLQVKVTPATEGQKTLTCGTTCTLTDNPTYIWYKNGQHLDESTSPQYKDSVSSNYEDSYSCVVKGHEDLHSPAVCVQGQSCSRVTYTKRRICVLKESTVDISCTYVSYYSTTSTVWFRSDKSTPEDLTTDPGYAGRVKYTGTYEGPFTLRITDLREEDSAEYRFTFKTDNVEWGHSFPGTTLTVTDLQVKVTPGTVTEGSWVTLTCSTTCTLTEIPNPTYIWYKNGEYLFPDSSPQYQYSVSRGGSDSYSCALRGHEKLSSPEVTVDTSSLSCLSVTYTSRSICSLIPSVDLPCTTIYQTDLQVKVTPDTEEQKRTLTCSTTCTLTGNPTYIWYRNGQSLAWLTSQQHSVWSSKTESYSCAVKGHEDLLSPAVCAQGHNCWRVTYTKRRICVLKGSTVKISCSYTHPTSYIEQGSFWFTQKHPVDLSSYPEYVGRVEYNRNTEKHHTMTMTYLTEKDSAEYKFRLLTTNEGRFSGLPGVMLTVTDILLEMDPLSVSEGERVTLRCRTKCTVGLNPTYIWYKNRHHLTNPVSSYNRLILDPVTSDNRLILDPVSSEDAGNYSCAFEGFERILSPEETLTVRYGPKNTSVSVSPSGEIVEGSSVTLTCSSDANPPVDKYTWYKKNGGEYQFSYVNTEPHLVFNQINSSVTGEYYCEAWNGIKTGTSESININVKYAPKNTSVSVSPSGEIVEGSSVTLTCSSDANPPVNKYTWYKNNVTSPKASGQSYSITNIISEDRGEYYCEAKNGRGSMNSTALMIIVAGKQTSVVTAAVGIIVVVLVLILCLSGLMWFRKKVSTSTSNTRDTADDGLVSLLESEDDCFDCVFFVEHFHSSCCLSSPSIRETLVQCMTTSQTWSCPLLQHRQQPQTTRMMFTTPASTSLAPKTRKCLCTPPSSCINHRNRTKMSNTLL